MDKYQKDAEIDVKCLGKLSFMETRGLEQNPPRATLQVFNLIEFSGIFTVSFLLEYIYFFALESFYPLNFSETLISRFFS